MDQCLTLSVCNLPPQQAGVLYRAAMGLCEKLTGREMGIDPKTVKKHREAIRRKTGAKNMNQAIAVSFKVGYLKYVPKMDHLAIALICLTSLFGGDHQSRRVKTQRPQVVTVRTRESFV